MATIVEIDGVGKVELDDSFKNLSSTKQQETIDEIANTYALKATPKSDVITQPSDLFAPGNEKKLAAARNANIAAIPGQLYGLGYGAAKTVLGGAGELENFARQAVPEFFGAKPLYNASNIMGDKSETFFPTMAQVKDVATTLGVPVPKDTSAETVGEFIPAIKAGVSATQSLVDALKKAKNAKAAAIETAAKATPSLETINKKTTSLYNAAKNRGVAIKPEAWNKFSRNLGRSMTSKEAMLTTESSPAIKAMDVIQAETATNAPISLEKADSVRQSVNGYIKEAIKSGNDNEARLAVLIKNKLDDFLYNLPDNPANYTGNAKEALPLLKSAREYAQRGFKAETISKFKELAEAQKGAKYNPVLVENALRDQFVNLEQQLIKYPSLAKAWTDAERKAIQKVVQGGPVQEAVRQLSKPFPVIGSPGSVIPIIGSAAKRVGAKVGQENVKLLDELVRRGGPAKAAIIPKTNLTPAAKRAALAVALSLHRGPEETRPNYEEIKE